jgi:serine/threonine-protein kinase
MPKIVLKFADKVVKEVPLTDAVLTIGRKEDNDLVIDNLAVSSRHARIARIDKEFIIQDTESTNGIFLNGEKVAQHTLKHGDQVLIGKHCLLFQDDTAAGASRSSGGSGRYGRYEVTRELGRGAMGTVYLGMDSTGRRTVAVKTLRFDGVNPNDLPALKERFFREAESVKQLSHPAIVKVYETGEERGSAYFSMEVLEGVTLKDFCAKRGPLAVKRAAEIVALVADALAYAHSKGVVHRDIKPANIMILSNGDIKVTDFGVARFLDASQTQTGAVLGTPNYMSPEQVTGAKVDGRSDLFSLGVVLYELLTGAKPFQAKNIAELIRLHEAHQPAPPSTLRAEVPAACDAIVARALQRELDARYQQGQDMARDLRVIMRSLSG